MSTVIAVLRRFRAAIVVAVLVALVVIAVVALALRGGLPAGVRPEGPRTDAATTVARPSDRSMPTGPARPPDPNAQIRPGCRRLRVSQRRALGRLAYLRGQAVYLVDFATCRVHPLSGDGTRPLRFSGDGAWLGFYDAIVAGVFGLQEEQPFGSAIATGDQDRTWSWAPMGAVLAGATNGGGVMIGAPGRPPRTLLADGWGANNVRFADARTLLVARVGSHRRAAELWRIPIAGGGARLVYRAPKPTASLQLAGVVDGWALVWRNATGSASLAADGLPLLAVSPRTGRAVRLARSTLVGPDFVAPCGRGVAIVRGGGREATVGKRVVLSAPPAWRTRRLGRGISPSCSASGRAVVLAAGPDRRPAASGSEGRSIWLVRPGHGRRRLTPTPPSGVTDEHPLLSPDGGTVLYVRFGPDRRVRGRSIGTIDVTSVGRRGRAHPIEPLVDVGTSADFYGAYGWGLQIDWRP